MNRELEALDKLIKDYLSLCEKLNTNRQEKMLLDSNSPYNILKQYLESIDRADFSEVLECLKRMLGYASLDENEFEKVADDYNTIRLALITAQEMKKALKLVFEKNINTLLLELAENVDEYNERIVLNNGKLTQEEFELLKRWSNEITTILS